MTKTLNREQVIKLLRERQGEGSASALARDIGVTRAYISDIFCGRRNPGPRILKYLGLAIEVKTQIVYRKVA